jgi:vacuolar-type H+-ATPase subunit C/Vma6
MSRASRYGFILAKVYGVMARSYVGKNYRDVLRLKKLTELYDLLYPGERPETTEKGLSVELEQRITRAAISSMSYVLDTLGVPVPILLHILRKYEYQNAKILMRSMAHGSVTADHFWDLGAYAGISFEQGQDPEKALAASPYAWVVPLVKSTPVAKVENAMDRDYYERLQALARELPGPDRVGVLRLVALQVTLANVIWALRLRFFFRMDWDRARGLLIPGARGLRLASLARVFEIAPDAVEEWKSWKFAWLLEDQFGDSFHAPDPLRAEMKARHMVYTKAHQLFHQNPFTLGPLVAYFTLKEQETALLTTAVEALQLSLPEQEALAIVGER